MAKRVSEFGKRWDERVPRGLIKWLMARVHVGTPKAEIVADIERRCAGNPAFTPALVRQSIAFALACHNENRALFNHVMRGR